MKKQFTLLFLCILGWFCPTSAQTVGILQNDTTSLQGYTFFSPFSGTKAYMIDNCGRLVNIWDRGSQPGLAAYFLDNGLMLRTYKVNTAGPFTSASNAGGLELVDWDNNTVWSYEFNTSEWLSHHDAVYMPNGNILVLTWELVYTDELIELGRNPNEIAQEGYMWSERIIEVEPIGNNEMNIVWEWQIKDHYIQDFDPEKSNFGVVADHPELFNINLPELNSSNSNSTRDWNHFNAIDYNATLDQILISVRNSDEIWILDHSTTTEEAATHSGGNLGRGGDIVYRWGNASAYEQAPVSEQKLFGQHGVYWIQDELEDAGKIMIFNNGNGRPGPDYSTVEIISPPMDNNGNYVLPDDAPFEPQNAQIIYGDQADENYYSAYLSNAQRLPNGNTLVNSGSQGTIFEVTPEREQVWKYIIPLNGDTPYNQGSNPNNNWSFRSYKFAPDFEGFTNIGLEPMGTIELGTNPFDCSIYVPPNTSTTDIEAIISSKYILETQTLSIHNPLDWQLELQLFDLSGRTLITEKWQSEHYSLQIPSLPNGFYFARIKAENGAAFTQKIWLLR